MVLEQIYTGCLAQGAYYIESNGEAVVIDPLREVQSYLDKAKKNNAVITYIFETHFHADFVSGHLSLAKATGAPIVFGPQANPAFDAIIAHDGQEFKVGDVTLKVIHTPGHTMESSCYLLLDEHGKEHALFSGDTLFLGDVGRPDLAQKAADMTQEELAGILYDSLHNKIIPLPDDVLLYPAHGAGSACGKNISKETFGPLGDQKKSNYALDSSLSKEDFIRQLTDGLLPAPAYFPANVKLNKEGYSDVKDVLAQGLIPLSAEDFEHAATQNRALVLDVRHQDKFTEAHIPNSIFIGLDGGFAPWVGAMIGDIKHPILLIVDKGREQEAITRLARVGFDHVLGYLNGGIEAWVAAGKQIDAIKNIRAEEVVKSKIPIVDVRKPGEFTSEHVDGALHAPLDLINDYLDSFDKEKPFYIHCAGGYRSVIAASILKSRGIHGAINILGGYAALKKTNIKKTDYICPSTLK
jgi:hydroxyacylglutathione hydrolase